MTRMGKVAPMTEAEWVVLVCRLLNEFWQHSVSRTRIEAVAHKRLPYRFEIHSFTGVKPNPAPATSYQTDILILETHADGSWTPRIVIEGKLGKVTTHDALTYSAKAATHIQVHPYLRYGILIGSISSVPLRLFRHGAHFDFMITWKAEMPNAGEQHRFQEMMMEEVEASQQLQRFIEANRASDKYSMVRRKLVLSRSQLGGKS